LPNEDDLAPKGADNCANGEHRVWPFDGPPPRRLTPEELEWFRGLWSDEDKKRFAADLRDMLENGGGISSAEFLRAIEQMASDNG
jgi:hypothetical protein